jgi:hypothetical protein
MDSFTDLVTAYGLFLGIPLIFLVIVVWVYRPGSGNRYREDGEIPFHEDDKRPAAPP